MTQKRSFVPLLPPELSRPYTSPADKHADWQRLLQRVEALKDLERLPDFPESQWPEWASERLQAAHPIADETSTQRLARWRSVFADEIAHLERAVTVASDEGGFTNVTDVDLRSAVYLAGRLLATLYSQSLEQVMP